MINWSDFEIVWDKRNKTHVLKHFIELEEVERAILFIVVEDKGRNGVRPITAYDANKQMKRLYKSKR